MPLWSPAVDVCFLLAYVVMSTRAVGVLLPGRFNDTFTGGGPNNFVMRGTGRRPNSHSGVICGVYPSRGWRVGSPGADHDGDWSTCS